MRKLFSKKGLGLLETIIAIGILAAVALPLLSIFVQSAKTDEKARAMLNANYICQNYTETLETQTYGEALANAPYLQEVDGYYLTAKIQPYGSAANETATQNSYSHIIVYSNGSMMAVMPDGQWATFSSVPSDITYGTSGASYTFSAGSTSISGSLEHSNCVVTINAMQQTDAVSVSIGTASNYKTILYSQSYYTDNYVLSGSNVVIEDLLTQDDSLVHVSTYIYEDSFSSDVVTSVESYLTLKNWE